MEKKKRILPRLFAALVILTLVSCCFIGSTFARYTSSSTGSATVSVAKWDISITGEGVGETTVEFGEKLSPSQGVYDGGDSYVAKSARTKSTDKLLVATIVNNSDVKASVTLATGATPDIVADAAYAQDDKGITVNKVIPTLAEVQEVFSIKLYYNTNNEAASATPYSGAIEMAAGNSTIYVYAEITWTSDTSTIYGDVADARDTWIGKYVTSVKYDITYTAVQASELPNA